MPSSTFTASCSNLIGHRIDGGRLVFESVLGVGAYGVVYLARDLTRSAPTYYGQYTLLLLSYTSSIHISIHTDTPP